jgi:DnaJ-class molecular chaperone
MEGAGIVLLIAAVIGTAWYVDLRRHPWRKCPSCGGRKTNAGSNRERWGTCRRCGGSGFVRRRGATKESR